LGWNITIVAVGRLKEAHWRDAADEYLKRLKPYATINVAEVPDRDLTHDEAGALAAEGADALRALQRAGRARTVALDAAGRELTSEDFAEWLGEQGLAGHSSIVFFIGGAGGLAPDVLAHVDERLSLGKMTLPHQLARVVLLEQVYRAFRILRGEPYHR
jgi:23S rRNA (pseudouridine1915-N3)-methyltransferase